MAYGALAIKRDKVYTYEDYLQLDENCHCEIVDGFLFMMAQPSRLHQQVHSHLFGKLWQFLEGKPCKVYSAPFGVTFLKKEDVFDIDLESQGIFEYETNPKKSKWVVEPDITVVCDRSKLTKEGCVGAPDFIIEITSPSSKGWDMKVKRGLYENNGVPEYWIVDIERLRVAQWTLSKKGIYDFQTVYTFDDRVPSTVLEGLEIDFSAIDLT